MQSAWDRLRALPLHVESYEFERRSATYRPTFERVTTLVRLRGDGAEGLGEDVSPFEGEDDTLHVTAPELPLTGEWTLESFSDQLAELDLWPVPPHWHAAVPLAQLGVRVRRARPRAQPGGPSRCTRPSAASRARCASSTRSGSASRRPSTRSARRLERPSRPALQARRHARLVAGADRRGGRHRRRRDRRLQGPLRPRDRRAARAAGHVRARDRGVPGRAARGRARPARGHRAARGRGDRISYDSPIYGVADLDTTPLPPQAVNIKPCRVGDVRSLLEVYAAVEERGLITYGGGMGELDVGRGQIQLLASLFHPEGPNDVGAGRLQLRHAGRRPAVQPAAGRSGADGLPEALVAEGLDRRAVLGAGALAAEQDGEADEITLAGVGRKRHGSSLRSSGTPEPWGDPLDLQRPPTLRGWGSPSRSRAPWRRRSRAP